MNALSKQQSAARMEHAAAIRAAQAELESEIDQYNAQLDAMKAGVEAAVNDLNQAIESAGEWLGEVSADMELYYDERSEKWQEGEKGQAYSDWKSEYGLSAEPVEVDFPEPLEVPDHDLAVELEGLPEEP